MSEGRPQSLSAEDFDAIEAAVMETARGRWFLAEYARRNRHADTQVLLDAVARVESAVREQAGSANAAGDEVQRLRRGIADMAESVSRTRGELAASTSAGPRQDAFDAVLGAAERADHEAFSAAGRVHDAARFLRGAGATVQAVAIEDEAAALHRAASEHALTTHRVRRIIGVLRDIEERLETLLSEPSVDPRVELPPRDDAPALAPPASVAATTSITFVAPDEPRPAARTEEEPPRPAAPPPPQDARALAFAAIDALEPEQKLALFV